MGPGELRQKQAETGRYWAGRLRNFREMTKRRWKDGADLFHAILDPLLDFGRLLDDLLVFGRPQRRGRGGRRHLKSRI